MRSEDTFGGEFDAQGPTTTVVNPSASTMMQSRPRHSPGTIGTRFPGAPDTIRTLTVAFGALLRPPSQPGRAVAEAKPIG
jgi:hypothetical protein